MLALRFFHERDIAPFPRTLTTEEFVALDSTISEFDRARFVRSLDFSTASGMDAFVRQVLVEHVTLLERSPGNHGIPAPVVDHFMAYIAAELALDA